MGFVIWFGCALVIADLRKRFTVTPGARRWNRKAMKRERRMLLGLANGLGLVAYLLFVVTFHGFDG